MATLVPLGFSVSWRRSRKPFPFSTINLNMTWHRTPLWREQLSSFGFKRPRTQIPVKVSPILTEVFMMLPSPSSKIPGLCLKLGHNRIHPHAVQFILFGTVLSEPYRKSHSSDLNLGVPQTHLDPETDCPDRVFSWFSTVRPIPQGKPQSLNSLWYSDHYSRIILQLDTVWSELLAAWLSASHGTMTHDQ
jgi:hypothetical protein